MTQYETKQAEITIRKGTKKKLIKYYSRAMNYIQPNGYQANIEIYIPEPDINNPTAAVHLRIKTAKSWILVSFPDTNDVLDVLGFFTAEVLSNELKEAFKRASDVASAWQGVKAGMKGKSAEEICAIIQNKNKELPEGQLLLDGAEEQLTNDNDLDEALGLVAKHIAKETIKNPFAR
jgi:hypothetical protein